MFLRQRPANIADLAAARDALASSYGHDERVLGQIEPAWRALLESGAGTAGIVEDVTDPQRPRPVAHGGRVFVKTKFAATLRSGRLGPTAGAAVLRCVLDGGKGVMSPAEMRSAQEGEGLTAVLVHSVVEGPFRGEATELLSESFFYHHRGYNLRECMKDVFSELELRWSLESGFRLRTSYGRPGEASPTAPRLISIVREEAEAQPGIRLAAMFARYPRRLGLAPVHKELAQAALAGRTDPEIAELLSITVSAVKKRWQSLYETVERSLPGLLPVVELTPVPTRGVERRRHLLTYLREHPEELLPVT